MTSSSKAACIVPAPPWHGAAHVGARSSGGRSQRSVSLLSHMQTRSAGAVHADDAAFEPSYEQQRVSRGWKTKIEHRGRRTGEAMPWTQIRRPLDSASAVQRLAGERDEELVDIGAGQGDLPKTRAFERQPGFVQLALSCSAPAVPATPSLQKPKRGNAIVQFVVD